MSFMFFSKEVKNGKIYYYNDYDNFSLAGCNNLIYQTWVRRGKPVEQGWTVTADELLRTYTVLNPSEDCNGDNYALLIDFHPTSTDRIGLIEIERIHIYTYGDEDYVEWSPMMLELKEIYYQSGIQGFSKELKEDTIKRLEIQKDCGKIIEFLYLNGDDYSWNWGRNGMTNAVFLHKPARDFFRQFF